MCGLTGFIDFRQDKGSAQLCAMAKAMNDKLLHRGPDSDGLWAEPESGVVLAHRRLAIIDLSHTGYQPMTSSTGRYIISFNGEIYNFPQLKSDLANLGHQFKGTSDTEVLLAAVEAWGLKQALAALNGMFAFALWDRKEKILHIARDRMGKKPLYYGLAGSSFLFGSELKALRAHPDFNPALNHDAIAAYTQYNYIPAPWSIYQGIFKLPPATFLSFSVKTKHLSAPENYW
ncbi:MAG: asparagine synthetase B, partial [Alphaproteobacteria bacterium]|nr:asparagine synthetase B [Alphaproteobacteria bacterium]